MRVLVIGEYGLIGGYVVSALASAEHEVIGAGRNVRAAARRFPQATWVRADLARFAKGEWAELLVDVDALVNCAGALQDNPIDNLEAVHISGLVILARAAHATKVKRLVHISAAGMQDAPGAFSRTKIAAEMALREEGDRLVHPSVRVSAGAGGFRRQRFASGLAGCTLAIPAVHASSLIQVVGVEDVV